MAETYNGKLNANEVQCLLKNIAQVLEHYSLKELNEYLITAVSVKGDNHYAEEYIISLVCETYKISRRAFLFSKSNYSITMPRQIAFCLLNSILGLSSRYISKRVFHLSNHNVVHSAITKYKKLDPSIKPDKDFLDSVTTLREKVLEKLNTKENK